MKIAGYKVTNVTNESIQVGCTVVTRKQVEKILSLMKRAPKPLFSVGQKVRVIKNILDSGEVLNKVGIVRKGKEGDNFCVFFPGWEGGHEGNSKKIDYGHWFVSPKALQKAK